MTSPSYFEDLYAESDDPWSLRTSPYEQRKFRLTVACLPRERYATAFEPACSVGALTTLLAPRCDHLLATDRVDRAVATTRAVVPSHVDVRVGAVPDDWPEGPFDLVVLSELLYFLDPVARAETVRRAAASLAPGGDLVAAHWRHDFAEAASLPEESHADLPSTDLRRVVLHEEDDVRIEVLHRD